MVFPCVETQFKPGIGGPNQKGRPKGSRNRTTIVREALEAIMEGTDQQVVDGITAAQIVRALTGDTSAFKELMDSGYGKNPDKMDFKGDMTLAQSSVTQKIVEELTLEQLERVKQATIDAHESTGV